MDRKYRTKNSVCDLPVICLDEVVKLYPAAAYSFFVAIGYTKVNGLREIKYQEIKSLGYDFISFIHPSAIIAPNVQIGANCFIFENAVLQPFVTLADNTFILSSAVICHHSQIGENVFIASNACVNGNCIIEKNCFIGANAVIRNELTIKQSCIIGAGCAILENTHPHEVYVARNTQKLDITSERISKI